MFYADICVLVHRLHLYTCARTAPAKSLAPAHTTQIPHRPAHRHTRTRAVPRRSLTLYGSGCFGDGSWHSLLKRIVLPVTKLGFPADLACTGMSLLTDKPAALSVFETLFYWFPNVDKHVRKRLLQSCFNYIVRRTRAPRAARAVEGRGLGSGPA